MEKQEVNSFFRFSILFPFLSLKCDTAVLIVIAYTYHMLEEEGTHMDARHQRCTGRRVTRTKYATENSSDKTSTAASAPAFDIKRTHDFAEDDPNAP